ncbi:unnamed protein product, partial [Ascophyllum nodosum]
ARSFSTPRRSHDRLIVLSHRLLFFFPLVRDIDYDDKGVYPYPQPPSGQSRVYRVTQLRNRWRSRPGVRRYRASSPQGSSSNGGCLFQGTRWTQFFTRHPFPTPIIIKVVSVCDTDRQALIDWYYIHIIINSLV